MTSARSLGALWAAKACGRASRTLGRGGGTALTGLVGLFLQPKLIGNLAGQLGAGSVFVTGTNGKTTTSLFLSESARAAGLDPVANASGSNLMRGIASVLCDEAGPTGRFRHWESRLGVFEVDEANLPLLLEEVQPRAVVLLNLFRDQLDRYGEVEALAARWRRALATLPDEVKLVLNADDPAVALLGEGRRGVSYFGLDDPTAGSARLEHASDSLICSCGARLVYQTAYFSHLGDWRCDSCGRARPVRQTSATLVEMRSERNASFVLRCEGQEAPVKLPVSGLYNVYNAIAAVAAARSIGIGFDDCLRGLAKAGAAFGRQEFFDIGGRMVELILSKNPTGMNQVLSTLAEEHQSGPLVLALNDGTADGRDISWIWDVDFERWSGAFSPVYLTGERADELALRLKYAGWDEEAFRVGTSLVETMTSALAQMAAGERLAVVPTYTAMLEIRELLAKRAGKLPYWSHG